MTKSLFAFGLGVGTQNSKQEWLEVYFPHPLLKPSAQETSALASLLNYESGQQVIQLSSAQRLAAAKINPQMAVFAAADRPVVAVFLEADEAPQSVPEAYLKLHLLSHRLAKPNSLNLSGIFKVLPNVAWTSQGAVDLNDLADLQQSCRLKGAPLSVAMVDKFPRMTDYIVPSGVRIADTTRVRLGAYVGSGTTVMQEGFINFNAGTEGPNMVEGRISAGVWVGAGSDLGGGCSTMGTLSGGNTRLISVGKNCLLGANAGTGNSARGRLHSRGRPLCDWGE